MKRAVVVLGFFAAGCAGPAEPSRSSENVRDEAPRPSARADDASAARVAAPAVEEAPRAETPPRAVEPTPAADAGGRRTFATDAFTIDHPAGLEADAEAVAEWSLTAVASLTEALGLSFADVAAGGAMRVRIAGADENRVRPGFLEVRSRFAGPALAAEIEILAPSAHPRGRVDGLGVPFGPAALRRALTREIAALYLLRLRRLRPGGWSYEASPTWFQQGAAEWCAASFGTDDPADVWARLRERAGAVEATPTGVRVANDVVDGALLVRFLDERFGRAKLRAFLLAPEADFYESLPATFGTTGEDLVLRYRRGG